MINAEEKNAFMFEPGGKRRKVAELAEKYGGTRKDIENKCTGEEWWEYLFSGGDDMLDQVVNGNRPLKENKREENESVMKDAVNVRQLKSNLAALGYYRGDIDGLHTPGLTKAVNDFSQDYHINEKDMDAKTDKIKKTLQGIENPGRLDFDGKKLRFIQNGNVVLSLDAMSGHRKYQNRKYQNVPGKGPLPEGSYRVKQSEIQDIDDFNATIGYLGSLVKQKVGNFPGGRKSWGNTRVWLEPFSSNNLYGRERFSIHGGEEMGSLGCIDLEKNDTPFFNLLRKYGKDIILNVHYDKEELR